MEEGTIVHIDYSLYNADNDKLLDTTLEEIAKENDFHQDGREYSPLVAVIGAGRMIEGFEESIAEAEAGKDVEIVIPAEKAYGERDSAKVETMSMNKLMRHVQDPNTLGIGAPVEIGGRTGILALVGSGRAKIDFNHPLAGRSLKYNYKIVKVIEERDEKVVALLESNTGHNGFEVEFSGDDAMITLPETMMWDPNASTLKYSVVSTLRENAKLEKITFMEVHEMRSAPDVSEEE